MAAPLLTMPSPIHPQALRGIALYNAGRYWEAHEALEAAWRDEGDPLRDLYRGILQAAVVCLHVKRGNYRGAVKVYHRCQRWLNPWPGTVAGIAVEQLRRDLAALMAEVRRLGPDGLQRIDERFFRPIRLAKGE